MRLQLATGLVVTALLCPSAALADTGGVVPGEGTGASGGTDTSQPPPPPPSPPPPPAAPGPTAVLAPDGRTALAPAGAPNAVKRAIRAANRLTRKPYLWGGGHASFRARGYDCSGAVSYVLHAIGLLDSPLVSGGLAKWGVAGEGQWITVYGHRGHAFMTIAGLRFDTSGAGEKGPRWRTEPRSLKRFSVRHAAGL